MSDSLTTLITKVQAALGDTAATYFSTDIVTAAVRAALSEINEKAPRSNAESFASVANVKEYDLTAVISNALRVSNVLLNDDTAQDDQPIQFDTYTAAEHIWFRVRSKYTDETFICIYTAAHTVNGLDSETTSTLPAHHDPILVQGAAYHALLILGVSRGLANNLEKSATERYIKAAAPYRVNFDNGLKAMAEASSFKSEPDTFAWNDEYAQNRNVWG